jgi:hypothetical protein
MFECDMIKCDTTIYRGGVLVSVFTCHVIGPRFKLDNVININIRNISELSKILYFYKFTLFYYTFKIFHFFFQFLNSKHEYFRGRFLI